MLFNSFDFLYFFGFALTAYYLLGALPRGWRVQNVFLFAASIYFYAYWDYRFVSLILFSTLLDYVLALRMAATDDARKRKLLVTLSLVGNLGLLGVFKYLNFFIDSAANVLASFGMEPHWQTLSIILPVGISFYTFQSLSYTIDVYRGQLQPTRNFLDFALFVAFFPQLVAGPIERASSLIPQIEAPRRFDWTQFKLGLHLMVWGMFKKVFVADSLAEIVDPVFKWSDATYSGLDVWLVLYAYALQIYCDFSGYTDIARGVCKTMGFELRLNFNLPYFALNPSDFWRRWHISLSSWLREYLYFSLGGNRFGKLMTYRNLFLTMLLGGLWHGAAWNFVLWGAFHGGLLALWHGFGRGRVDEERLSKPAKFGMGLVMLHLTCIGWLLFRAQDAGQIADFATRMFTSLSVTTHSSFLLETLLKHGWLLIVVQIAQYMRNDLDVVLRQNSFVRLNFYLLVLLGIATYFLRDANQFIYFQF